MPPMRPITVACLVLIGTLLLTGLATWTPIRHLIQVTPILFAIGLTVPEMAVGKWAALAVFVFWLGMQTLVWGVAGTGASVSTIEVVLSVAVAAAAVHGIRQCLRFKADVPIIQGFGVFAVSALMQFAAFLVSVLPAFAGR